MRNKQECEEGCSSYGIEPRASPLFWLDSQALHATELWGLVVVRLSWLSGRALVAPARGVLGPTPGGYWPFSLLYFCFVTTKFVYFQCEARSCEHTVDGSFVHVSVVCMFEYKMNPTLNWWSNLSYTGECCFSLETDLLDVAPSNPLPRPIITLPIPLCVFKFKKVWLLSNIQHTFVSIPDPQVWFPDCIYICILGSSPNQFQVHFNLMWNISLFHRLLPST